MAKSTWLLICIFYITNAAYSQDSTLTINEDQRNSLYFELGGNGGLYSLNYERIIVSQKKFRLSGRAGASYVLRRNLIIGGDDYLFPITIRVLRDIRNSLFEIGFGNTVVIDNIGAVENNQN